MIFSRGYSDILRMSKHDRALGNVRSSPETALPTSSNHPSKPQSREPPRAKRTRVLQELHLRRANQTEGGMGVSQQILTAEKKRIGPLAEQLAVFRRILAGFAGMGDIA